MKKEKTNKLSNYSKIPSDYVFLLDIDGTLVVPGSKKISQKNLDKIKEYKQKGAIFALVTGRSVEDAFSLENIQIFNYVCCISGNAIFSMPDKKLVFLGKPVQKQDAENLANYLDNHNFKWAYKTEKNEKTHNYPHCDSIILLTKQELYSELNNDNVFQFICEGYVDDNDTKNFPMFNFVKMPKNYTDIQITNCSKEIAVNYFKNVFPERIIVAMGDSENDMPMLENAVVSVAMGNASDEIKKKCDFVSKPVEQDGVSFALDSFLK